MFHQKMELLAVEPESPVSCAFACAPALFDSSCSSRRIRVRFGVQTNWTRCRSLSILDKVESIVRIRRFFKNQMNLLLFTSRRCRSLLVLLGVVASCGYGYMPC